MKIELLHHTPLIIADIAISKCYNKEPYDCIEKQQSRIDKVANVSKHSSTIEHLVYSFDVDGISRAVLQELARHRIASYTVKSTRYTLKELKDAKDEDLLNFNVSTNNNFIDLSNIHQLKLIREALNNGLKNDIVKYMLPESYKTALVWTINARSLQNFIELRSSAHALWEIQEMAEAVYNSIPEDHKFLFDKKYKKELSNVKTN